MRLSRHVIASGALVDQVAAGLAGFELFRHHAFRFSSYDPVVFGHAVRFRSHFQLGAPVINDLHNGFGRRFSAPGDHWSPILASLTLAYWMNYRACDTPGRRLLQLAGHLVTHPLGSLRPLVSPRLKIDGLPCPAGACCLLPTLSAITLAVIPWLGRPLVGAFPVSAGSAQFRGTIGLGAAGVMLALAVLLMPKFGFSAAFRGWVYFRNAQVQAAAAADAAVPPGAEVDAEDKLEPQLPAGDTVPLGDGDGDTPLAAAFRVVANVSQRQDTFNNIGEQRQRVLLLRRGGYRIIFERDGYLVLHRGGLLAGHGSYKEAAR
jgi:hypothetical protein